MDKDLKYGNAISRLEEIMSDIQKGNLDVDVLNEKITEAKTLIAFCRERLYKVDEDVKKMLEGIADNENNC